MSTFHDVVEVIKELSLDEKQEIQLLLQQYIREERREDIFENFQLAQLEEKAAKIKFSNQIDELRQML
ncbi:MAG: hypothetical protein SAJ37_04665 [Oscillatoria sp. PMC 1068.18]|nr:hypothetical protein [Oscillatoria sp. PMC 1076.18]MEC4988022.1 hypothetical protein [Oscillatoria sp. PMC 1068.18]